MPSSSLSGLIVCMFLVEFTVASSDIRAFRAVSLVNKKRFEKCHKLYKQNLCWPPFNFCTSPFFRPGHEQETHQ